MPVIAMVGLAGGCQWFERRAINGSIKDAFLEINTPDSGLVKLASDLYTLQVVWLPHCARSSPRPRA
jgi:hypothetical protein